MKYKTKTIDILKQELGEKRLNELKELNLLTLVQWSMIKFADYVFSERGIVDYLHKLYEKLNEAIIKEANPVCDLYEVRKAFADYEYSEGCSCCRDIDAHNIAEKKLGELLQADRYDDNSGYNWQKYRSKQTGSEV